MRLATTSSHASLPHRAPTLVIALAANGISLTIGVFLGLVAGYFRNAATELLMRVSDVVQSFPVFISAMVLVRWPADPRPTSSSRSPLSNTPIYLRLTRSEVLSQKSRGYVEAARALGRSELSIAARHVLPNSLTRRSSSRPSPSALPSF